jgi:hypothetical protein
MTMAAFVLTRYRDQVQEHRRLRGTVAVFALAALVATGVANSIGAFSKGKRLSPALYGCLIFLSGRSMSGVLMPWYPGHTS